MLSLYCLNDYQSVFMLCRCSGGNTNTNHLEYSQSVKYGLINMGDRGQ